MAMQNNDISTYVLDGAELKRKLHRKGFNSLGELCNSLGIHRNSLSRYLSGSPILPKVVEQVLDKLGLDVRETLIKKTVASEDQTITLLAPAVSAVVSRYPNVAIVLFGSRSKAKSKRYSDADLGILDLKPLTLEAWSHIRELVDAKAENLPFAVDVVDLGRASPEFMASVKPTARFLGGNPMPLLDLGIL